MFRNFFQQVFLPVTYRAKAVVNVLNFVYNQNVLHY